MKMTLEEMFCNLYDKYGKDFSTRRKVCIALLVNIQINTSVSK